MGKDEKEKSKTIFDPELNKRLQEAALERFAKGEKKVQARHDEALRKWAIEQSIAWRATTEMRKSSFRVAKMYFEYAKTGKGLP